MLLNTFDCRVCCESSMQQKSVGNVIMPVSTSTGTFPFPNAALGNGKVPVDVETGMITFPTDFCCMLDSQQTLQSNVFSNIQKNFKNMEWLCERVILASKNDAVYRINKQLLD